MSTGRPQQTSLPIIIATALLVACSASGLVAGGVVSTMTGNGAARSHAQPTTSAAPGTPTLRGTAAPSPTVVPSRAITQAFRLDLSAKPNPIQPGQPLDITIQASDNFTHAPIAGLACSLENPEDGGPPLLTAWPAPAVTDVDGQALWSLTLPQTSPGIYEIGFTASGAHGYRYHGQVSISVASAE
ncbi:MAG TPA: hypothetical protein VFY89_08180 [Ktedonobacterales bacterium]